jgi:protein-tyrosine phosphatase
MADAVALARLAVADGTRTVVATPHVADVDLEALPHHVRRLRARLAAEGIPLEVRRGGEVAARDVPQLTAAQLSDLAQGPPTAPWILLEAPLPGALSTEEDLGAAADELRRRGFGIVLAHPERVPAFFDGSRGVLRGELLAGSVPQINAGSLLGAHGSEAQRHAAELARGTANAVVASDAHGPARPPALTAATEALIALGVPAATARAMTGARPRSLLHRGLPVTGCLATNAGSTGA